MLLLAAAAAEPAQALTEKGQNQTESCYSSQVSNATVQVSYARSAAPRETTFTFVVRARLPSPLQDSTHACMHASRAAACAAHARAATCAATCAVPLRR